MNNVCDSARIKCDIKTGAEQMTVARASKLFIPLPPALPIVLRPCAFWRVKTKEKKSVEDDVDFENLPYFHGKMTRIDAEDKLQGKPQGTFLTRFV